MLLENQTSTPAASKQENIVAGNKYIKTVNFIKELLLRTNMELFECIKTRRSVRSYQDKPIPWDLVAQILDAGRLAPSAGNLQNWKFIVVLDEDKKEKVVEACLQQTWMLQAPVHIVVVSEPNTSERFYPKKGKFYSTQNCAFATENMLLQAHSLKLGTCLVGFDERRLRKVLNIPDEAKPELVITLGYPADVPKEPVKFPLENVTYFNNWRGKIRDFAATTGYSSIKIEGAARKAKAILGKQSENIKNKAKQIADKIKKRLKK